MPSARAFFMRGLDRPMSNGDACAVGIDFGTTNSVVAIANRSGQVETLSWPSFGGPTQTFRTALMFWREGRSLKHVAGPAALQRAIAAEDEQRFIQSIKTYLASSVLQRDMALWRALHDRAPGNWPESARPSSPEPLASIRVSVSGRYVRLSQIITACRGAAARQGHMLSILR